MKRESGAIGLQGRSARSELVGFARETRNAMIEPNQPGRDPDRAWVRLSIAMFAAIGLAARQPRSEMIGSGAASKTMPTKASAAPASKQAATRDPGLIGVVKSVFDRFGRGQYLAGRSGDRLLTCLPRCFPALAMLVSIYGLFADPRQVAQRVSDFGGMLPPEALKIITDGIGSFAQKSGSQLSLALLVSLVLALWSARAGMSSVMTGLNIAYEEEEKRSFIMQNVIALALTLGGVVFAIIALLTVAVVPAALALLHADGLAAQLLAIGRWPVLALIVMLAFAVIYRYAPSRSDPSWRWITWGSGVATAFMDGRISHLLLLRRPFRLVQRHIWCPWRRGRHVALVLGERRRASAWCRGR